MRSKKNVSFPFFLNTYDALSVHIYISLDKIENGKRENIEKKRKRKKIKKEKFRV